MKVRVVGVVGLVFALFSGGALAQYRCVESGKTVITDRPCSDAPTQTAPTGNAPKVIGDAGNSAYSSPYGDWRGDAQFQFTQNGQMVADAHAVVPMTISISPQGKVVGAAPQNGCKVKGLASPGLGPTSLSLDLTFSGCQYPKYNRRMPGHISLNPSQRVAQLYLSGIYIAPFGGYSEQYDVKATMRR